MVKTADQTPSAQPADTDNTHVKVYIAHLFLKFNCQIFKNDFEKGNCFDMFNDNAFVTGFDLHIDWSTTPYINNVCFWY